ncbi:MAG: hypothetical protein FDX02_01365 [Chlorobium sp.]|nr:MAG: hypothetical protein FDX02_01365 [Chlorobium sp.]
MAKNKKSGGFFSSFRREPSPGNETVSSPPSPVSAPSQRANVSAEVRQPSVGAAPAPAKSVPAPVAQPESAIDTVEAFKVLCQSLTDIAASQLKVAEMMMNMVASSLNKISKGAKPKS